MTEWEDRTEAYNGNLSSYDAVKRIKARRDIWGATKTVAIVIASHYPECFASRELLSDECGFRSVNTFKKHLNELIECGLADVLEEGQVGNRGRHIVLNFDKPDEAIRRGAVASKQSYRESLIGGDQSVTQAQGGSICDSFCHGLTPGGSICDSFCHGLTPNNQYNNQSNNQQQLAKLSLRKSDASFTASLDNENEAARDERERDRYGFLLKPQCHYTQIPTVRIPERIADAGLFWPSGVMADAVQGWTVSEWVETVEDLAHDWPGVEFVPWALVDESLPLVVTTDNAGAPDGYTFPGPLGHVWKLVDGEIAHPATAGIPGGYTTLQRPLEAA